MKSNFHNFNRKKQYFISEIEMHCMFTNEREKNIKCMHNLKNQLIWISLTIKGVV